MTGNGTRLAGLMPLGGTATDAGGPDACPSAVDAAKANAANASDATRSRKAVWVNGASQAIRRHLVAVNYAGCPSIEIDVGEILSSQTRGFRPTCFETWAAQTCELSCLADRRIDVHVDDARHVATIASKKFDLKLLGWIVTGRLS